MKLHTQIRQHTVQAVHPGFNAKLHIQCKSTIYVKGDVRDTPVSSNYFVNVCLALLQTSGGEDPKVPGTEPITQERPVSHLYTLALLLCCACSGSITHICRLQRFQTQLLLSAQAPCTDCDTVIFVNCSLLVVCLCTVPAAKAQTYSSLELLL